jgi:hypothetical protein
MKCILLSLALALSVSAECGELSPVEGFVMNVRGPRAVIFLSDDGVTTAAPVVNGEYSVMLPGCRTYKAGLLSGRGYYFPSVDFYNPDRSGADFAYRLDFAAVRINPRVRVE